MTLFDYKSQRGQSIVIVTIFLLGLLAILALVIDGGNGYLKRRRAQNAADAGALAGARVFCEDPENNSASAISTAASYVDKNNASLLPGYPSIDSANGKVTVGTTITFDTFFGSVLNLPQMKANAIATAGCYSPCYTEGVLPIVWTCATDEDPPGTPGEDLDCKDLPIPISLKDRYEEEPPDPYPPADCELEPISGGALCPHLVIIKDNTDVDDLLVCAPAGGPIEDGQLDCDLDDDGKNDYLSAENRGWADLDGNGSYSCPLDQSGTEGQNELQWWIENENGYECGLHSHTWVGDQSGDPVPIYNSVRDYAVDRYNFLPVFTKPPCEGDPRVEPGCFWHPDAEDSATDIIHELTSSTGQTKYYHIEDFAVVWITCVQKKDGDCPAATAFANMNDAINPNSYMAIEGYFIKDYEPGSYGKCEYNEYSAFNVYLDD